MFIRHSSPTREGSRKSYHRRGGTGRRLIFRLRKASPASAPHPNACANANPVANADGSSDAHTHTGSRNSSQTATHGKAIQRAGA